MKEKSTRKPKGWIKGGSIGVGSFLAAVVLSGFATTPYCAGRDLRLWAFITAPASLVLVGILIGWFRICKLRHIILTLCTLVIVAAIVNNMFGGPSQNAVTASFMLGMPWCIGLTIGHMLRKWRSNHQQHHYSETCGGSPQG